MKPNQFYGWKLIAALWLIVFFNLVIAAYGSPVMNAAMAKQMHSSHFLAGLPYSLYTMMSGVPALAVAYLVRRFGVRGTVMLGSALIFIGAVSMATLVHSAGAAIVAFGVIVGVGVSWGGPFGVQPSVANWFVRRRALALAIVYSAGGVGGFIAARALNKLVTAYADWRVGWWVYAGTAALAFVLAALCIRNRPSDLGQVPDGVAEPAAASTAGATGAPPAPAKARPAFITREVWSFRDVFHSGRFWIIALALCGGSAGYTLFLSQGIQHLIDLGHSSADAALAVSLTTGSTLLGKVVLGTFGDRIDPRYIYAFTLGVFALGFVLVLDARSMTSLYVFSVCLGLGFGGGLVCLMSVLSNYFGAEAFPVAAGLAGALNTSISFVLSAAGGYTFDHIGSFAPAFYTLAGWCLAGAVALLMMRPPVRGAA